MFNGIYKKCLLCKEFVQKNKFSEHNKKYHLKEEIKKSQDNSSPKQKKNNNNKEIGKIKFSKIIHNNPNNPNLNKNESKENFKKTNQGKSNKDKKLKNINLQNGNIEPPIPTPALGTSVGTVIGEDSQRNIIYEVSECTCHGFNERCIRCDGTGFFTKTIINPQSKYSNFDNPRKFSSNYVETNFSNDSRGEKFSIREKGRFLSNPLHDDYDE